MSNKRITEQHPALFVIMLDHSASMGEAYGQDHNKRKADIVAEAVNQVIFELGLKSVSTKDPSKLKDKFEVILVKYWGEGWDEDAKTYIESAYGGNLAGRWAVKVSELFENPLTETIDGDPVWVEADFKGNTPMKTALDFVYDLVNDWITGSNPHYDCVPPVVLNITDGVATDSSVSEVAESMENMKSLKTSEGDVYYFNNFLSGNDRQSKFENNIDDMDEYGENLFNNSSLLSDQMCDYAKDVCGYDWVAKGVTVGFMENGLTSDVVKFLQVGTFGSFHNKS